MGDATVQNMTCSVRDLAIAALCALAACSGCKLGTAEEVTRSPDLGPVITTPLGRDAASDNVTNADLPPSEPLRADGNTIAWDTRDAGPDASIAKDGATNPVDTQPGGIDGGVCGLPGLVFCDDFENGAVGWMSTGETWAVTDDLSSVQPNQVFAPAGPAASGAYWALGAWQDMTVEVRVRVTTFGQPSSSNRAEIYARYQDSGHFYAVSLRGDGKLGLRRNASSLGPTVGVTVAENAWHTLKIKVSGPADAVAVEGYLDGTLLTTATDTDGSLASAVGTIGVGIYGETLAVFDDIKVSSP